jgi:hypothetical protein
MGVITFEELEKLSYKSQEAYLDMLVNYRKCIGYLKALSEYACLKNMECPPAKFLKEELEETV